MNAFRTILSRPGSLAMTTAGFIGRFPMGMIGLAVTLLVVSQTDSYGLAGAIAATVTLSAAVGGPLGARLSDRFGQHRVLPPLILISQATLALLTWAVISDWPRPLWFVMAAIQGLTLPNIGAMVRSRWARMASNPAQLNTAFALESTLDEVAFVIGPPLATMLAVAVAPWSAVVTGILLSLSGTLILAAQRRTEPPAAGRQRSVRGGSWSAVMVVVVTLMFLMGGIFAALELATVAFAQELGVVGATGWFLGAFALASMATGLFLGMRELTWRLSNQLVVGFAMLLGTTAVLPWIDSTWLFGLGMFATGLGCSAIMIGGFQLVERVEPAHRLTQSLAVAGSGIMVGSAVASAVAGAAIDARGSSSGMGVAALAALAGLALALAARKALERSVARAERARALSPMLHGAGPTEAARDDAALRNETSNTAKSNTPKSNTVTSNNAALTKAAASPELTRL